MVLRRVPFIKILPMSMSMSMFMFMSMCMYMYMYVYVYVYVYMHMCYVYVHVLVHVHIHMHATKRRKHGTVHGTASDAEDDNEKSEEDKPFLPETQAGGDEWGALELSLWIPCAGEMAP